MEKEKSNTAYINGSGKVHLHKKLELSGRVIRYEYNMFYYIEILKLLVNIHDETITLPGLNVYKIFTLWFEGFRNIRKFKDGSLSNMEIEMHMSNLNIIMYSIYHILKSKKIKTIDIII